MSKAKTSETRRLITRGKIWSGVGADGYVRWLYWTNFYNQKTRKKQRLGMRAIILVNVTFPSVLSSLLETTFRCSRKHRKKNHFEAFLNSQINKDKQRVSFEVFKINLLMAFVTLSLKHVLISARLFSSLLIKKISLHLKTREKIVKGYILHLKWCVNTILNKSREFCWKIYLNWKVFVRNLIEFLKNFKIEFKKVQRLEKRGFWHKN